MKTPKKIGIIGAGGITCHLAPILALDYDLVLVDGDKFEASNSTRQFPALCDDGIDANKATYLAERVQDRSAKLMDAIPQYLKGPAIMNEKAWEGVDMVFGCVDNNQSRQLIIDLCDRTGIPGILCGNETDMGEAHLVYLPAYNPFNHHDFGPMTKAPFSCTSDENAESAPQTSSANYLAAACGIHILMSWRRLEDDRFLTVHSMMDSRADSTRTRLNDYLPPAPARLDDEAPATAVAGV